MSAKNHDGSITGDLTDPEKHECNIIGDSETFDDVAKRPTSFKSLFRHATRWDILLNMIGMCSALIGGLIMPFVFYIYGYIANTFVCHTMMLNNTNFNISGLNNLSMGNSALPSGCVGISEETYFIQMRNYACAFVGLGVLQLMSGYVTMTTFNTSSNNQLFRVQCLFLESFLRQDMSWFDNHRAGEFASRAVDDLQKFKDGIGDKIGMVTYYFSVFAGCVILSLAQGWKLSLVILAASPLTVLSGAISVKVQSTFELVAMQAYAKAGNIAEEVISSIRTVFALGGELKEIERYEKHLIHARRAGMKSGLIGGVSTGINYMVLFCIYGLAFWYGIKLILEDREKDDPNYTPQNVSAILINVIYGTYYIGQITPHLQAISIARSAIVFVYEVIDRIPPIDSSSENGLRANIEGNVTFEQVHFEYPSRPGMKVLQGLDLEVKRGETVALVGESGCGKSTAIQLLQRFYDPLKGVVKIDDIDLKMFNVGWLRQHIGVVAQEPILFEGSILDNIKFGNEDAKIENIIKASKQANAHSFVIQLPHQYNTLVGERGAQLSGGQKQRIAIARALISNPKILLLDEATSALDTESETLVQNALENATHGRTTIVVAHRLSTVRNASKIVVLAKGSVVESGTHEELMQIKGIYCELVTRQVKETDSQQDRENEDNRPTFDVNVARVNSLNKSKRVQKQSLRRHSSFHSFRSKYVPEEAEGYEEDADSLPRPSILRLLQLNSPEWYILMFGALGSLIMGLVPPTYALVFGEMFGAMSVTDPEESTRQSEHYAIMFLVIGVAVFVGKFLEIAMFSISGEILTQRLRKLAFTSILKQEAAWFDCSINGTGALCSRLAGDAANVQSAARSCSDAIVQSACAIVATVLTNLILDWRLGLVALAFLPLIILGYYLEKEAIYSKAMDDMQMYERANKKAVEAISNLKTLASLHREKAVFQCYSQEIEIPYKRALRSGHLHGLMFGFSQCTISFSNAAILYYGSVLFHSGDIPYKSILIISELMIASSFVIGQVMSFAPNYNKALVSAARIFQLCDRKIKIDSFSPDGISLDNHEEVDVEFRNVYFNYPTRENVRLLQGLNLVIPPGKVSALVGTSGCGKSTCIQLLQRFYDSNSGLLLINNKDIKSLNIKSLRSCIGIVSQEPVLFDKNIAENIAYGDNSRNVPMNEIIDAAVKANIHNFITSLPEGYNTGVGARGLQLSGGQKQRIAIARALVRNPKILLLDEATSALDAENEAVVQKTLEQAQKGRTCITIAHRLTTIQSADCIFVLHKGRVAEIGTHEQLLEQRGHYFRFYNANLA